MEEKEYLGTYAVRKIGKNEMGIHLPSTISGTFSIYQDKETGVITLVPQG